MNNTDTTQKSLMQKLLDGIEVVGNKVPHPSVIFLALIAIVIVLSHVLSMTGASATYQVFNQTTHLLEDTTTTVRSLLTGDGIRFIYGRVVPNFLGFTALGQLIVAMIGVGVAEETGLIKATIRKLMTVAPPKALCYILVLLGILSSVASNAGYLILIPLAGAAFLTVGRHPLAGLAAGFAAVGGTFTVNLIIKPADAVLVEIANDAIHLINPTVSIGLASNLWFSIASVVFLTVLIVFITERIIEPRLGKYDPGHAPAAGEGPVATETAGVSAAESRGLKFATFGLLGTLVFFGLLTLPPGAPLRDPGTGALIGDTPFMNGLIAFIFLVFLVLGISFGIGAGVVTKAADVIKAIEKTLAGLAGMIFVMFLISQFVAYFNYSNMATVMAVSMADSLKSADIGTIWLLLGFIVVVAMVDLLITGSIAKWAIFAPIFIPVLMRLGVAPEAVLAAYRIADSPPNVVTPLLSMFALIVGFFAKYDKRAGIGTILSLMLTYAAWMLGLWTLLFVAWYLLGIPWGI